MCGRIRDWKIMAEKKLTKKLKELLINSTLTEDFRGLIDSVKFEDTLSENIFNIIGKYVPYDACGVFFNEDDENAINVLNLSYPNKNVTIDLTNSISDKFFDEMEPFKQINRVQCNLITGDVTEESKLRFKSFKTVVIEPFKYAEKLTGGFFFASTKKLDAEQKAFLQIITNELELIFKLRYLFNEQSKRALYDPMTGLYNRQEFDNAFEFEFSKARRYIYNFSLAIIDIDYLGKINDKFGRPFGDFVLTELSSLLKRVFRRTDPIYRYGSEEIVIMLPFTPITKALIPIERLRTEISRHEFEKDGKKTNITVSVGLCANYSKFEQTEQFIEALGTALSRAKERGRNKVDIFE